MTIHPTGLRPLDEGTRYSVTSTAHPGCPQCLALVPTAGATFDDPANAGTWANGAASLDFNHMTGRTAEYHSVHVRRERAQPWTPPAWTRREQS